MKKIILSIISIVLLAGIIIVGSINVGKDLNKRSFKFYLVSNDGGEESKKLLFTGNDIEKYYWEKQEIIFKKEFLKGVKGSSNIEDKLFSEGSKILNANFKDKFIIYLNKEKIYEGHFKQPVYSSYYPIGAVIEDIKDGIKINWNDDSIVEDARYDKRIYNFLKNKKLYF